MQKSIVFLYSSNKQSENKIEEVINSNSTCGLAGSVLYQWVQFFGA